MRFLVVWLAWLAVAAACGPASHGGGRAKSTVGAVAGMTRDANSGANVSFADVQIAGRATKSNKLGLYEIDNLPPGRHTLSASYAGQPVTVTNVEIHAGLATYVDVSFRLGEVTPIVIDFGDPRASEIQYFTTTPSRIEGTVTDASTRARVPGAVVTAAQDVDDETLQVVTDDHGRYRFDGIAPGTYAVSAYYSVAGRSQIEVRRSGVTVAADQGVLVPLLIELAQH